MKHNETSRAHRFLLNSKAILTSESHIPKRQRLQGATTKYINFETQNYLLCGNQAPWAAESSHSILSYTYTVIHKLTGCR
jgi:hypothetical protein